MLGHLLSKMHTNRGNLTKDVRRIHSNLAATDIRRADVVAGCGIDHCLNRIVNGLHRRIIQIHDHKIGALPGVESSQVIR